MSKASKFNAIVFALSLLAITSFAEDLKFQYTL